LIHVDPSLKSELRTDISSQCESTTNVFVLGWGSERQPEIKAERYVLADIVWLSSSISEVASIFGSTVHDHLLRQMKCSVSVHTAPAMQCFFFCHGNVDTTNKKQGLQVRCSLMFEDQGMSFCLRFGRNSLSLGSR
jgi:hypothetical protein